MIFQDRLHSDEYCPYGSHWDFHYSGRVLVLSEKTREIANVELSLGHTTRGGFFVALRGDRPNQYPVLITDRVESQAGPIGTLHFVPADPSVRWAGSEEEIDPKTTGPIYYGVQSDGWFGVIQFTSIDTARLRTYTHGRMPEHGDQLYFTHDFKMFGSVVSFEADLA